MNFIKRNIKLIIVFFMGVILASGTIFAYSYYANDISYTKQGSEDEITVATALNDLYGKVPSGTKTIEATGSFDVSQYATAVVQNLYTLTQYNNNYTTGYNAALNSVLDYRTSVFPSNASSHSVNLGYVPRWIFICIDLGSSNGGRVYLSTDSCQTFCQYDSSGVGTQTLFSLSNTTITLTPPNSSSLSKFQGKTLNIYAIK